MIVWETKQIILEFNKFDFTIFDMLTHKIPIW